MIDMVTWSFLAFAVNVILNLPNVTLECTRHIVGILLRIFYCNVLPSRQSLKESIRRYLVRMAMSSHMRCCSKRTVGEMKVLLMS